MHEDRDNGDQGPRPPGEPRMVPLGCPDCGGGLARVDLPQISYFRCHVGHQYGPQSLAAAQAEATEDRLWRAVSALEEQVILQEYLESMPVPATVPVTPAAAAGTRRGDLMARATELREQVQRWTGADPSDVPAGGQPPSAEPS